jgi:diguanylate cyclase (GGDEF)-like protein/PAS domain S-box-containing protein
MLTSQQALKRSSRAKLKTTLAGAPAPSLWGKARGSLSRAALVKALNMTPDAVLFLDAELKIVDANAAATAASGYFWRELTAMSFGDLLSDPRGLLGAGVARVLAGKAVKQTIAAKQRKKSGDSLDVQVRLEMVDDEGKLLLVAVVQNAEAAADPEQDQDFLTRLPTRQALEQRLRRVERRTKTRRGRFALLFIDVDRFKSVNDALGHRAGDAALQALGRRLAASVRPGDFVARYGGDEFVALIENVATHAEVQQIVARIHAQLNEPIQALDSRLQISVSVGVAMGLATTADALLDEADRAMYRMKQLKRLNCLDSQLCRMRMEGTGDTVARAQ